MADYSTHLPPGFRFFPSDEELVVHFLHRKATHLPCQPNIIPTIDIRRFDPWDLNGVALQGGDQLWYFFTRNTQHRTTPSGHWSSIGDDETVGNGHQNVGIKRTLVFYFGEMKTNWMMHEYHLLPTTIAATTSSNSRSTSKKRENPRTEANKWILCGVYESSCNSENLEDSGRELSCLDEVFLSLDDLDEVSLPNYN